MHSLDHTISGLLLRVYRAAREDPPDVFLGKTLALTNALLPFDSATWGQGTLDASGLAVQSAYLYREVPGRFMSYEEVRRHDTVAFEAAAKPGRTLNFHFPTLYAAPEKAGIREFARRVRHANELVTSRVDDSSASLHWLAFFRANPDDQFSEPQRKLCELLFPHLVEALHANRHAVLNAAASACEEVAIALVDYAGGLHCSQGRLRELLELEWPEGRSGSVPVGLVKILTDPAAAAYRGKAVTVDIRRYVDLAVVTVRRRCGVDRLSARELEVAELIASGCTYKEISRVLGLSPATVRNYTQRIHERLGVHTNVGVANVLRVRG